MMQLTVSFDSSLGFSNALGELVNKTINYNSAIFCWLKDNEGRYFIAVDTHIQRVANRTGYAKGKTIEETEKNIVTNTPNKKEFMYNLHHRLILHGRYTCIARKPRCGSCIIEDLCGYKNKTE
jgi:endonuclease-3